MQYSKLSGDNLWFINESTVRYDNFRPYKIMDHRAIPFSRQAGKSVNGQYRMVDLVL